MIKTILNQTTTSELLNSSQVSQSTVKNAEPEKVTPAEDWDVLAELTKSDLEEYAESKYGITLNQSNTKPNMSLDFQDQLTEL